MAPLHQVHHFIIGPYWRPPFSAAAAGEHPRRPRGPVDTPGPKHKRWHKQQRQLEKEHQIVESTPTAWSLGGFQQMVVDKKASGSNYQELVATGFELMQKGHFKAATKKLRRAIALDPEQPDAYGALSEAMEWSNDTVAGARLKVQALERADKRSRFWACTAAAAFDSIRAVLPDGMEAPDWWNDEDLLCMSATVLSMLSHEQNHMPFLMRARVLVHGTGVTNGTFWQPGPRGSGEVLLGSSATLACGIS